MKGGVDERASEAGLVTGGGESGVQVGGGDVDVSQYQQGQQPSGPEEQQQPQEQQPFNTTSYWNGDTYDYAAAAEAAERAAREAAERRRIEALNESQHRENDKNIREAAYEKQRSERVPGYDQLKAEGKLVPVDGYDNLEQDTDRGGFYPKGGVWTDEADDDLARHYDEWLFDTAGHADVDVNREIEEEKADQEYWERKEAEEFAMQYPNRGKSKQGNKKWKPKNVSPDKSGYRRSRQDENQQAVEQAVSDSITQTTAPQTQVQQEQEDNRTEFEKATEYFGDYSSYRNRDARDKIAQGYNAWRDDGNEGSMQDYLNSDDFQDDPEAFMFTLKSLMSQKYPKLGETEVDEETGEVIPRQDTGIGTKAKDTLKQDRLIDNVVRAFKIGFFHVTTEHVDTDEETGQRSLRWSRPVESRIIKLCDYLGMDRDSVDSHRTVFRLVTLYGSIGFDRQGKMFNQDKDEWSLTEGEFCDICDMIYQSCVERGHPLAAPFHTSIGRSKLRNTDIVPSGVLPKVVAQAITGPNSQLRLVVGGVRIKPTAADLVEACRQEWVSKTYPWVKANLIDQVDRYQQDEHRGSVVAQRIAIEDMQQALARLDGMGPEAFSSHYGVDTSLHYKLEEYRNTSIEYAQAANGLYDSDAVDDFQQAQLLEIERMADERKSREIGAIESAANIVTAGIKTNALFWNVPIAVSAIAEKGVGDVQTDLTVRAISKRTERVTGVYRMNVSQQLRDAFKTDEAHKAIDGALLILEIAGPGGLTLFSKTGKPLTQENAEAFVRERYMPDPKTESAAKVQDFNRRLSKFQQKLLTGDIAFKDKDAMNFLNSLLTCNQVLIGAQEQLVRDGRIDSHAGMALTGAELDDIFLGNNGDITRFLAEVFGTPAGRDSLIMMRSNNIGNFNPIGYNVDKVLRDHGITNAMVTTFFDSFPKYGINFLYSITPFSRSLTYLEMKRREASGDITAGMFTIGGGLADVSDVESLHEAMKDPAFQAGLRMNLMYDAMTIGRWSVTTIILGGIMAILGFEPPDKDEDFLNISMWKIGGQEIQIAYWLNDLTQLGLPGAYGLAAVMSGQSPVTAMKLALSSLYDQVDGNVIMDFIKAVKTWDKELEELEKMGADPSYLSGFSPSYGAMELLLSAGDKIVPVAPLYRYIQNDAFIRGDYARAADPNKVYDKSSEWAIDVGKTDYVEDPTERMIRRHSTSNWALAAYQDFVNGIMFNPDSEKTGYFWWEMPPKTRADQLVLTWRAEQEMDYTNREGCKTDDAYKELKTDQLLKQIEQVTKDYGGIEQAVMNGYFISHDVRYAALDVLSDRLILNELEFQAMDDAGSFAPSDEYTSPFAAKLEGSNDFYSALAIKKQTDNEIWDLIKILQNDDIPMWYEGYEQIITDKDITYTHEDGTPALPWEYLVDSSIQAEWKLKGNHPWAVLPWTNVDYSSNDIVQRGFSGETVPFWYNENATNLDAIINGIGQKTVPMGKNAGEVLNDVLFYRNEAGELVHTDKPTIDERALIPVKAKLSDDIKKYDVSGKVKEATEKLKNNDSSSSKKTYPKSSGGYRSSYSRRSYGRGGRAGSGNYNPKIYSSSPNVNSDRAATMYTKNPQSARTTYLRPSFSTKGSREAYKRQDF